MWDDIKTILYEYERFIDKIPHTDEFALARSKPGNWHDSNQIMLWLSELAKNRNPITNNKPILDARKTLPETPTDKLIEKLYAKKKLTPDLLNSDNVLAFSLWLRGYCRLESVVNRVRHIGEIVSYTNTIQKDKLGLWKIKLDVFDQDSAQRTFTLI